jgi:cytochrome c
MDPLGNNKIFAAILGAALVFMMIRTLPEVLMHNEAPKVPAYIIGEMEDTGDAEVIELPFPQADWVSAMDAERGAKVFKSCASCHNVDDGGPNGTGPGLWNVVGAMKGVHADFSYSAAMSDTGTSWTYEALDGFLEKPKSYLPGTKMNFVGIRKESDRAAVIEYLRLASADPLARPEPAAAAVELTVESVAAEVVPAESMSEEQPVVDPTDVDGDMTTEDAPEE